VLLGIGSCSGLEGERPQGSQSMGHAEISGGARVLDGDTVEIAGTRIRLHGIDAAEGNQLCQRAGGGTWDCAGAATERLRGLMSGRTAACRVMYTDRYGRSVAACRVGDLDVQEVLVREGLAWAYRLYSRDYVPAEEAARAEARGIWQGPTEAPWDWRRQRYGSAVASTTARPNVAPAEAAQRTCAIKGNINSEGVRIYHTPASPW
jgi:endonuclease YncB( thermonuclease family)